MTASDEEEFSSRLVSLRPRLTFIDGDVWASREPPVATSIHLCASNCVYLWDKEIVGEFAPLLRKDGRFDGPQSSPVPSTS